MKTLLESIRFILHKRLASSGIKLCASQTEARAKLGMYLIIDNVAVSQIHFSTSCCCVVSISRQDEIRTEVEVSCCAGGLIHQLPTYTFALVYLQFSRTLHVCGGSAVHGAGPGQVAAGGGAALLRHGVLHLREHGALELLPEVVAHEHVQHRVEDAVGGRRQSADFEADDQKVAVEVTLVELQHDEHVVRKPAEEERSHERTHDSEGLGGLGHPVVPNFEDDDRVADDDDGERHHEPRKEAAERHYAVAVLIQCVLVDARGPAQVTADVSENDGGNAERDGQKPSQENNHRGFFNGAVVLGPNREDDQHQTIDADDDQEEDAAEHVDEQDRRDQFAHDAAEYPHLHHHAGNAEGKEGAEDKVGHGEAQIPGGVDRLPHLEAGDPDDQSISTEAQQRNGHTDHQ